MISVSENVFYLLSLSVWVFSVLTCSFVSQWKCFHSLASLPQDGHIAFLFRPLSSSHFHLLPHTNTGVCLISQRSSSDKAVPFSAVLILWVTSAFHACRVHTYASDFTKETTHGCTGTQKGKGKIAWLWNSKTLCPLSVQSQCSLRMKIP